MKTSAAVRQEIEEALYRRVPGALSPQVRGERVRLSTGLDGVDAVAQGGFPVGAITELVGQECSGRTTLTTSFVARRAAEGQVFAWVDVTDSLDPESMAAAGVDLERMLWVRCGRGRETDSAGKVVAARGGGAAMVDRTRSAPSLSGGCGSPHPRSEGRGMSQAIGGLMSGLAAELMMGAESRGSTRSQPGGNKALLPVKRKDKSIGTPSAANRVVASEFSWRSEDREEQVPTDRRPARRGNGSTTENPGRWEPRCAEPQGRKRSGVESVAGSAAVNRASSPPSVRLAQRSVARADAAAAIGPREGISARPSASAKSAQGTRPWSAIDHALRVVDMLLQAGGFGVVVLDLGSVDAEAVWRIPMATWFRFRAAAERSQTCLVLLTQYGCARSSAELVLEMEPGVMRAEGRVMTGVAYGARVGRQRFVALETQKVVAIRSVEERDVRSGGWEGRRRPPQPERTGAWSGKTAWAQAGGMEDVRTTAVKARVRGRSGRTG